MNSFDHILDYEDANGIYSFVENATDDELTQAVQYYDDAYRRAKEVADNKLTILETLLDGIIRYGKFSTTQPPMISARQMNFHDDIRDSQNSISKDLYWLDADGNELP